MSEASRPILRPVLTALLLTCGLSVGLTGCTPQAAQPTTETDSTDEEARSEVVKGPVSLTVEVTPAKSRLSDETKLTITVRTNQGIRVTMPPFGESIGDFVIRDFYESPPNSDGHDLILTQVYALEPTRAGRLSISPIAVPFSDDRQEPVTSHTVESEAITIDVSTVVDEEAPSLADLRPPTSPVELPASKTGTTALVGAVLAVSLVVLMVYAWWRRRHLVAPTAPQLSPQELAWLELEQIVERDLARTDVKEYYVALTGVVRRYIERSTGVRAPEQTTEEFLREIADTDPFPQDEQTRLRSFLESADLVKFAGYQPRAEDIEASFRRAQEFIGIQTKQTAETAA